MNVLNGDPNINKSKETSVNFLDNISKLNVKEMLMVSGMTAKLNDLRINRLRSIYKKDALAIKAIDTVLVRTANTSIKLEEETGRKNTLLERKTLLYLDLRVKELVGRAILENGIGADKMIYSIDSLNESLGNDNQKTVDAITQMNVVDSTDMILMFITVHNINERMKTPEAKADTASTVNEAIKDIEFLKGAFRMLAEEDKKAE
ncbi:MAG: hypothetical protein KGH71_01490 [Candidatus Micrarchaeota archaeon]|nr:hypothetical protein [Candidatus Micrarchaeota archaeon]